MKMRRSASMQLRATSSAVFAVVGTLVLLEFSTIHAAAQLTKKAEEQVEEISTSRIPFWLTLDGEVRGRTEAQTAIDLQGGNRQVYELTRVRGGLEVRPSQRLLIYAQFQDAHALGLPPPYTATNMRDSFDLRQAYLKYTGGRLAFFAGRQELRLGEERLIGISNWTNVSRTYDVIDARLGSEKNRLDLFSGSVVRVHPTAFDRPGGGFSLHGAYATLASWVPNVRLEPFVLFKTSQIRSQQGLRGKEVLVAPGIRAEGHLPAGFDYDLQGTLERGSYGHDSIHAGAAYVKGGYTIPRLPGKVHVEPEYDYATGNPHRNPLRVSTFDQFYPSNHDVFGLTDLFGWQNIKQRRINLDMQPSETWYLLLQGGSLHAATRYDAVYAGDGSVTVAAPSNGFPSDDIGSEFDASARFSPNFHISFEAGLGHFWPGGLLTSSQRGAPLTLAYFQLAYQLKWNRDSAHHPGQ
jgi:hypothetical protein